MTIGVDLCHTTGELSGVSTISAATAKSVQFVAGQITAITVDAVIFGDVAHSASLAAGLVAARETAARLAGAVQFRHEDLTMRSGAVAKVGEQLTAHATATAARVGPER